MLPYRSEFIPFFGPGGVRGGRRRGGGNPFDAELLGYPGDPRAPGGGVAEEGMYGDGGGGHRHGHHGPRGRRNGGGERERGAERRIRRSPLPARRRRIGHPGAMTDESDETHDGFDFDVDRRNRVTDDDEEERWLYGEDSDTELYDPTGQLEPVLLVPHPRGFGHHPSMALGGDIRPLSPGYEGGYMMGCEMGGRRERRGRRGRGRGRRGGGVGGGFWSDDDSDYDSDDLYDFDTPDFLRPRDIPDGMRGAYIGPPPPRYGGGPGDIHGMPGGGVSNHPDGPFIVGEMPVGGPWGVPGPRLDPILEDEMLRGGPWGGGGHLDGRPRGMERRGRGRRGAWGGPPGPWDI